MLLSDRRQRKPEGKATKNTKKGLESLEKSWQYELSESTPHCILYSLHMSYRIEIVKIRIGQFDFIHSSEPLISDSDGVH